jgi:aminoglycoside 3-N-acetyltransferase
MASVEPTGSREWPAAVRFIGRSEITDDLAALGVAPGDTILVHASQRSLGYVVGGATAVVGAFLDAIGADGTLVAPAYTPENRDPSRWTDPVVPPHLWPVVRDAIPPFDPVLTPSARVGAVAERIRSWPGAVRSTHPQTSFAAIGPRARELMAGHAWESPLGERSPLARLTDLGAKVVLLGVGYDRCTAFHLAEYRLPDPPRRAHECAVATGSSRQWITFDSVDLDAGDFARLSAAFAASHPPGTGRVGAATAVLLPIAEAVEFAVGWLRTHRK